MTSEIRKPPISKIFSPRTTFKSTAISHLKASRGYALIVNPKKTTYNGLYNKRTFNLFDVVRMILNSIEKYYYIR